MAEKLKVNTIIRTEVVLEVTLSGVWSGAATSEELYRAGRREGLEAVEILIQHARDRFRIVGKPRVVFVATEERR